MNESEIRQTVLRVIHGVAPDVELGSLDPEGDLRTQADLDSVDAMNVVIGLHRELGVEVPEADYPEIGSIDAMVAYVAHRLGVMLG